VSPSWFSACTLYALKLVADTRRTNNIVSMTLSPRSCRQQDKHNYLFLQVILTRSLTTSRSTTTVDHVTGPHSLSWTCRQCSSSGGRPPTALIASQKAAGLHLGGTRCSDTRYSDTHYSDSPTVSRIVRASSQSNGNGQISTSRGSKTDFYEQLR